MDNGLVQTKFSGLLIYRKVLILIVVEDGLVRPNLGGSRFHQGVLILIVVEDGLVLHLDEVASVALITS